jgi:hypothetical protein
MAQNGRASATSAWAELTDANITRITVQNTGGGAVEILGTTGSTPTASEAGMAIPPNGALVNEYLSDLFPGVAGVNRVFIRGSGNVFFSHS